MLAWDLQEKILGIIFACIQCWHETCKRRHGMRFASARMVP